MRAAVLALAALTGCGRIGFGGDPLGDAADAPPIDILDAADDILDTEVLVAPLAGGFDDRFGYSVALSSDGTTLAVGAWGEGNHAGSVYIFVSSGTAWAQEARLEANNREVNDVFGYEIAIAADGNTLVVGAPDEDSGATVVDGDGADNSANSAGAAYVIARAGTAWMQQAYLKPTATDASDNFGCAVAIDAAGDAVAIGAYTEDAPAADSAGLNTLTDSGAAYVFTRTGPSWSQSAFLKAPNADANDGFGVAVAMSGDGTHVAVSATSEQSGALGVDGDATDNSQPQSGAVYVFDHVGAGWQPGGYLKPSNTDGGDFFGYDLAFSADGRTLAVSAEGEDGDGTGVNGVQQEGAGQAGAVYVFERPAGWTQVAYVKATNTEADDRFGRSVALSADARTLVVGAALEDSGETGIGASGADNSASEAGAAYVSERGAGGWAAAAYLKATSSAVGDQFGAATAVSANGARIVIGAFGRDNPAMDSGAVYVFD
jgi:hypothetical protein